jgi:hypothetical protein
MNRPDCSAKAIAISVIAVSRNPTRKYPIRRRPNRKRWREVSQSIHKLTIKMVLAYQRARLRDFGFGG